MKGRGDGRGTKERGERPGIFRLKKGHRKIEWNSERKGGWERNKRKRGEACEESREQRE